MAKAKYLRLKIDKKVFKNQVKKEIKNQIKKETKNDKKDIKNY